MSKENPKEDTKLINYYRIENDLKSLTGKVLTIIDASIVDKQQNKATKDLVKKESRDFLTKYQDFYWEGRNGHSISFNQ